MKNFNQLKLTLLCVALVHSLVNADPLTYEVEGESVTVIDCDESAVGELVIPSSYNGLPVISIKSYAFSSCRSLTSVTISDSVTSIGSFSFGYCSSLTSVTIPDSVTSIEEYAFWDCSSLTSVMIPDSVTSIENMTFKNCSNLTSVLIGNKVTSIGRWAFKDCLNLKSVTIPGSVKSIGSMAFSGCNRLNDITFLGNAPSSFDSDVFKNISIGAIITVTAGATGFGETYGGLPVQVPKKKLLIKFFNSYDAPFSFTFETQSDSTYKIEASNDLKKWREIGEAHGTGSPVKFTDWREALFSQQYYRVKIQQ